MKFAKTKLAAAIAAATMASAANAVVVVGGDNGWEVSFDGNVNAFYTFMDQDNGVIHTTKVSGATTTTRGTGEESSRVHSGFLPAFFSFNVKSPTVNGLTGKGRFSFAPTINRGKSSNGLGTDLGGDVTGLTGATIDTREVLGAVDGSFGEVSFGRTLGIYGRQAILHDMTLFGVGNNTNNPDFGTVGAGRIGVGYLYPDFEARIAWASPAINGFKLEVAAYDPIEPVIPGGTGSIFGGQSSARTDTPRFEGELSYATSFTVYNGGGNLLIWADGLFQSVQKLPNGIGGTVDEDLNGVGGGVDLNWNNFELTGYGQRNEGTGLLFKFANGLTPGVFLGLPGALNIGSSYNCNAAGKCETPEQKEWYVQGSYAFGGKTKVGFSYGKGEQDQQKATSVSSIPFADIDNKMWTVGVYHDMTSWLKLVAEYNNVDFRSHLDLRGTGGVKTDTKGGYNSVSVGAFITW